MFAVYAAHTAPDDSLSALKIGERPEPEVPQIVPTGYRWHRRFPASMPST